MNQKIKLALAAAALFTTTAAVAGPHHWGQWGPADCPYADDFGSKGDFGPEPGFGPRHHPGHGPMPHHAKALDLESPYMANLAEQTGLSQDYNTVLRLKDDMFAKRQVLKALTANSTDAAAIKQAAIEFTEARRTLRDARWILFDKISAKFPQGWPTMQSQALMPK